MARAVSTIRALLKDYVGAITLAEIDARCDLKTCEISMALCYLLKQRYVTRVPIKSNLILGRKEVWLYTYYSKRQPIVS
jgi:predicted transcriptional regulator